MPPLALVGSARPDGDAATVCGLVTAELGVEPVHLGALDIRDYAYGRPAGGDDFLPLARRIAHADGVLLVTPVYWYAMSGVLKRFMDRLTDLVTVEKPLGRRLAGRGVWVAACGSESALPDGFEVPFRRTADYLSMVYGGIVYAPRAHLGEADTQRRLGAFGDAIRAFSPSA